MYGATDSDAFALDQADGRQVWQRHLTGLSEQFVDVAPIPWHGFVFLSTIGYRPFGRGAIYGLDRGELRPVLPEILEWAELADFGQSKLKTLSTGMRSRLAFSATASASRSSRNVASR